MAKRKRKFKLYSFTTVKDEEDIIESFVRYNMCILDGMVISDNSSNDATLKVLKELKKEGYNIDILEDKSQYFDQNTKRRKLYEYTISKYHPDFVFPLDGDEFIATFSDTNPRKVIEGLDKNYLYRYKMINYVVDKRDPLDVLFIPERMKYMRSEDANEFASAKCFISNEIYKNDLVLAMGCHSATYADNSEMPIIYLNDIFLAHFPVRSKEQITNKVITGRLNNSSLHSRSEGLGFHQYEILDEIIENGEMSDETVFNISKYYGIANKKAIKSTFLKPITISFCTNRDIKYSSKSNNKILSNTIKTSEAIIDHMRDKVSVRDMENEKMISKYKKLENKYSEQCKNYESLQKNYDRLYGEYSNIIGSRRWKLLNKFLSIFRK